MRNRYTCPEEHIAIRKIKRGVHANKYYCWTCGNWYEKVIDTMELRK